MIAEIAGRRRATVDAGDAGKAEIAENHATQKRLGRGGFLAVILVGLVGLAGVGSGAWFWHSRNLAQSGTQFRTTSEEISGDVTRVLNQYGGLLSGSAALFHQGIVSRAQYADYLQALGFGSAGFAGLQGVGLIQRVTASAVPAYLSSLRADGIAVTSISPSGSRAQYCLGSYADWRDLKFSIPLYGYDFCTVPNISNLLTRATQSGQQQVLGGSLLGAAYSSYFVLVQPVYTETPTSVSQRERQVSGWVLGIADAPGLLKSLPRASGIQFLVSSGTNGVSHPDTILRSPASVKAIGEWPIKSVIESYGKWNIWFRAAPGVKQSGDGLVGPLALLFVGLLAVVLLAGLLASLLTSRSRALRAVDRTSRSLKSTEERFRMLVQNSSDLIAVVDDKLRLIYASPAAERLLGYVPAEQVGRSLLELIHPDDFDETSRTFFTEVVKPGVHPAAVFRFQTSAGEWRVLEVIATNCMDDPAVAGIVMNARDITERTNLTRALLTLGKFNQVLVNASEESSLLFDTCKTIIDAGSYQLAWVGYVVDDSEHSVRAEAWAGQSDILKVNVVHWSDDEHGGGPTGTAIRTRSVQVIDDVSSATTFAPWQTAVTAYGVRSSCTLPLEVNGEVVGALSIYASEPGTFGPPEVALLKELADALAYGIGRIRDADLLQASEERFRSLAGAAPIGILEVSSGAVVNYANPRVAEITGLGVEALMGRSWIDAVHPEDKSELVQLVDTERTERANLAAKFKIQRPGGDVRHVRLLAAPKGDVEGGYVVTIEDVTEEVEARDALSYQAFYDNLTGLPNRALFLDRLNQELARHRRNRSNIAVLFLDLDRFKLVNDSLGHESGDIVLREVGERFKRNLRVGETAARLSGDEFAFIIRDVHKVEDAIAAAKRVQALLEPSIHCPGQELTVTASVGIVIPASDANAPTVLRDADAAMYLAKEKGRNRFALFDEGLHRRSVERLAMEGDIRLGLTRHEFEVYYQPIVDPSSGRPMGAEALLRWHHPVRGLVPPLEFIPVAEDSGLIRPLGRWVFDEATSQMAQWAAQLDEPNLAVLSVNFSSKQVDDLATPGIVRDALERHRIDPRHVCVEVTESVAMADSESTRHSLESFKQLGIQVAIDDFGTGYSSLAYLHSLPVTTVKVDRSFIERLGGSDDSTPVVKAVIEMSHAMGLRVVAEGVSNEHLATIVSTMGCDAAQGFFWAHPMPAQEFVGWWREAELRNAALSVAL